VPRQDRGINELVERIWRAGRVALLSAVTGLVLLSSVASARSSARAVDRLGAAPAAQRLNLVFPLPARLGALERFATSVSTPGSAQYGQFESVAQLAGRFGVSARTRARVLGYLRSQGATGVRIDATGLFADASLTVSRAERLFGTSLRRYHGSRSSMYVAPTTGPHIPRALHGAISGVVGLDTQPVFSSPALGVAPAGRFPRTAARFSDQNQPSGYGRRTGTASGCAGALAQRGFTPNQYLNAYGYSALRSRNVSGQGERVALIEIDGFNYSDLVNFARCFGLRVPAIHGYGVNLKHPLPAGGESTLDLEVLDAAAPGLNGIDVYESQARSSDVLRALTAPLQNHGRVPDVISASLGICEPSLELAIGRRGIRSVEGALAMASATGISVLASSGDAGSSACIGRNGPLDFRAVNFPASSPYVTAVGGTNFVLNGANRIVSQRAWNDAPEDLSAGGGGSSSLFGRPRYQKGIVHQGRRAVPDVSMLADVLPGYDIYCTARECQQVGGGSPWIPVGGTSAAAPLFAGGLSLVDQALREHGRQNLGVANPLLYRLDRRRSTRGAFRDIRIGNNDLGPYLGHGRPLGCCSAGRGYDRVSGLGTVGLATLSSLAVRFAPALAKIGISLPRQRAVARHHLIARLTCSRACLVRAQAVILAGAAHFSVSSSTFAYRRRGAHKVKLRFSRTQLSELRAALRGHRAVYAVAIGEIVDPGGNLERRTKPHRLRLRG
jgi:subtilase family serine protease